MFYTLLHLLSRTLLRRSRYGAVISTYSRSRSTVGPVCSTEEVLVFHVGQQLVQRPPRPPLHHRLKGLLTAGFDDSALCHFSKKEKKKLLLQLRG